MKETQFTENIIKFEGLIWLKDELSAYTIDKQIAMMDILLKEVAVYADTFSLPHPTRKTWDTFKNDMNPKTITGILVIQDTKTLSQKIRKFLDKLSY